MAPADSRMGDLAVVSIEADDLEHVFSQLATSQEPFGQWFREVILAGQGLDLSQPSPPPELVVVYERAGREPDRLRPELVEPRLTAREPPVLADPPVGIDLHLRSDPSCRTTSRPARP
ncbi:MAG: hypothetical protein ACRDJ4_07410 [Actinomycetota bacterium]